MSKITSKLQTFTVTSDGRTGLEFIKSLKQNGYRVGDWAADVMQKPAFVTTNGKTYRLGLINGEEFSDSERTTKNIRAEAARRGWLTPPAEVAPLLRETVSDEEIERLGLWWLVVMHEPIIDSDGDAIVLSLHRLDDGRWLATNYGKPDNRWDREGGFLFLLPQESLELSPQHSDTLSLAIETVKKAGYKVIREM